MPNRTKNYQELKTIWRKIYNYNHLLSMADLDRNTVMPPKGNEARAKAMAELEGEVHRLKSDSRVSSLIASAEGEDLNSYDRANLDEIKRDWIFAGALTAEIVERKSLAAAECEHAWRSQRKANDWAGFLPNFKKVVLASQDEAKCLSDKLGLSPYNALMSRFEPGMTTQQLDSLFSDLKKWLPALITKVVQKKKDQIILTPKGPFKKSAQLALGPELMQLLGFDLSAGALSESTHPFCGGVPEDVRITTRYSEDDALNSVLGTIHETGHARYEQNLPRLDIDQPIARARSMGFHESQSLSFEMQLARSKEFIQVLAPLLVKYHGNQPAFEVENLVKYVQKVEPSFIRVEADEVTYPMHVILRYEIEQALIEGKVTVNDVPELWDQGMKSGLGLSTNGNYQNGCMQDVHWPAGMFGYFPSYTLGAIYAAQWFATLRKSNPDLKSEISKGHFTEIFGWLNTNIWSQGSRWSGQELCFKASGEALNSKYFREHLEERYLT